MPTLPRPLAAAVAAAGLIAAVAVPTLAPATAGAAAAAKPGLQGTKIRLGQNLNLSGGAYDIATDKSGTAYLAWIAQPPNNGSGGSDIYLCVLPPRASACKGGIQSTYGLDASGATDVFVVPVPGGPVTLVWYDDEPGTSKITESTVTSSGGLTDAAQIADAPTNGELLTAIEGPDAKIWTVSAGDSGDTISVRDGFAGPATTIRTPDGEVDFAKLAFSGNTPIIAMHYGGQVTHPVGYTYKSGSSWASVKNVAHTWTSDADLGLVDTTSGVRLIASEDNADYHPVIAKWTGNGFGKPVLTGDTSPASPSSHDLVADASGRAADISIETGNFAVANLFDTVHAAITRFPTHGTTAGSNPQIATNPRGDAWVAWSVESGNTGEGDTLFVSRLLLPGARHTVTKHAKHGSVTVVGPASCLPADTVPVSVKGHPKSGWKVKGHSLKLGSASVGSSIAGASLTANQVYTLTGTVTFGKGGSTETVKAALKFRSCPNP